MHASTFVCVWKRFCVLEKHARIYVCVCGSIIVRSLVIETL